jgi:tetratricopeptide (TPR) repeat protein
LNEAKAVAEELRRVNAESFLNIKPKSYTYNQYVPFQTREQLLKATELANQKNYDEAVELLEQSLEIYRSHVAIRFIGEIYYEQDRFDEALIYFDKVYDEFEFDPAYLKRLAIIYAMKKDFVNARKYMAELEQVAPNSPALNEISDLIPEQ